MNFIRKYDTPTVKEFRRAQEARDEFFDTPKYIGLSLEKGEEVDRILNEVLPRMQTEYLRQTGMELERGPALMQFVPSLRDAEVAQFLLMNFAPRMKVRRAGRTGRRVSFKRPNVENPERTRILEQYQTLLAKYFPRWLEKQLTREEEAALGEQAFEAIAAR